MPDSTKEPPERRPILIVPMSLPESDGTSDSEDARKAALRTDTRLFHRVRADADRPEDDSAVTDKECPLYRHNWLQPLRAIYRGLDRTGIPRKHDVYPPPKVIVVRSCDATRLQETAFRSFVEQFECQWTATETLVGAKKIELIDGEAELGKTLACDFSRFFKVRDLLSDLIRSLEKSGYGPDQVAIDATGGTKPFSMGAVVATMMHEQVLLNYCPSHMRLSSTDQRIFQFDAKKLRERRDFLRRAIGLG